MRPRLQASTTDVLKAIEKLSEFGATSLMVLAEDFKEALLVGASGYTYRLLSEVVGSGENVVKQQMGMFTYHPTLYIFGYLW